MKTDTLLRSEFPGKAMGVSGRFHNVITWPSDGDDPKRWHGRIANQKFTASRPTKEGGRLRVKVRFDDECKNGHETLSVTATEYDKKGRDIRGGCMHDDVEDVFPEFASLIPFHLCSTDGPMHYIENTIYLSGNRDCHGLQDGQILYRNEVPGRNDIHRANLNKTVLHGCGIPAQYDWQERYRRPASGSEHVGGATRKWLPISMVDPDTDMSDFEMAQLSPIHRIGEGKERELDSARRSAIWPEATDDQLCSDRIVLEGLLRDRLPDLIKRLRTLVEEFGFIYPKEL